MGTKNVASRLWVTALVGVALGGIALVGCGPRSFQARYHTLSITLVPPPAPKKIEISERIQFERGKARLRTRSHRVLDQVAGILKKRPDIRLVEIQGHTDSKGKRARNLRLSLQRAEAVRSYLIDKGVEEARLSCKGHGPDQPVTSNDSRRGRRQNRRVEFIIVQQRPGVATQAEDEAKPNAKDN